MKCFVLYWTWYRARSAYTEFKTPTVEDRTEGRPSSYVVGRKVFR